MSTERRGSHRTATKPRAEEGEEGQTKNTDLEYDKSENDWRI